MGEERTAPSKKAATSGDLPAFVFGEASRVALDGVHPHLVALAEQALRESDVDFGIHSGVRSREQQEVLVRTERSRVPDSRHVPMARGAGGNRYGHAIDVHVVDRSGRPVLDWPIYAKVDEAFKRASIKLRIPYEWGGRWRYTPDGQHFELPAGTYPKDGPIRPLPGMSVAEIVGAPEPVDALGAVENITIDDATPEDVEAELVATDNEGEFRVELSGGDTTPITVESISVEIDEEVPGEGGP